MSFGWSAGDIATAVTLLYNIIEALDDVNGAADNYREATGFLRDLKRTLEPLQTLTAWNAYPTYRNEIAEQVQHIRGPVEEFLNAAVKYEPSLGAKAKKGHHRHVWRKLQWYLREENKVSALKNKIGDHMRIIDTLICRLILDVGLLAQEKLPGQLRAAFTDVLSSELVSHLHDNLVPLRADVLASQESQKQHHYEMVEKLSEHYTGLSSGIQALKEDLRSSTIVQQRIESCLSSGSCPRNPGPRNPSVFKQVGIGVKVDSRQRGWPLDTNSDESDWQPNDRGSHAWNNAAEQVSENVGEESLRDVYYLVLLYIGHFLKNFFLALSRLIEPSRAMMPVLLAKYNISFLDAIGSPPRILPYEYFRNFRVLQTFIREEFKTLPGSTWVNRGLYGLLTAQYSRLLAKDNWSRLVTPGTTVTMAMLVRKTVDTVEESTVYRCPEKRCKGTWPYPKEGTWAECPVCQKKVLTTTSSKIDVQSEEDRSEDSNNPRGMQLVRTSGQRRNRVDRRLDGLQSVEEGNFDFDDIEIEAFRRILEIHSSPEQAPVSATGPDAESDRAPSVKSVARNSLDSKILSGFKNLHRETEDDRELWLEKMRAEKRRKTRSSPSVQKRTLSRSIGSDTETEDDRELWLEKMRAEKRRKSRSSPSVQKRMLSQSIGSDTDDKDLQLVTVEGANEAGSSARRLRRKVGERTSLIFDDPPPRRIDEEDKGLESVEEAAEIKGEDEKEDGSVNRN